MVLLASLNPYLYLEYPWVVLFVFPVAVLLWILLKHEFVKLKEDPRLRRRRLMVQKLMIFSRTIIVLLLLIALATPFRQSDTIIEGDPVVTVLVDNSSSMALLEKWDASVLESLRKKVEVNVRSIGSADLSDLGDSVLNSLGPYESVVLVSDGRVTKGADLGDVALWANRLNSSVNAISLDSVGVDASVRVLGPSKVKIGVPTDFVVQINRVGSVGAVPLKIIIDGKPIFDRMTDLDTVSFNYSFDAGIHRIMAFIDTRDFFAENNQYFKTVNAVPKPKVLFWTAKGSTPILTLLRQVFDVETVASYPSSIDDAYALIVDDIGATLLNDHVDSLTNYVTNGNGMLVIGGRNSYNNGRYKSSLFETLLPVQIARAGRQEGDINIVIVIDISGSTGAQLGEGMVVDVMKAMAIDVIQNSLRPDVNLGVVAFNSKGYIISDLSPLYEKPDVTGRIARLKNSGGTLVGAGILRALELLAGAQGSKNIILISDGRTQGITISAEAAKQAANKGVKIYSIAVGKLTGTSVDNMRSYAEITNGIYYQTDTASRLRILFGEIEKEAPSDRPDMVVINPYHFMTEGLDLSATVSGWNDVVPKTTGKLLITTSAGDPLLTSWRLGLGRVAAWSTDDGQMWAGETLGTKNSEVWTRLIDWVIGEPDRKLKNRVEVQDGRVNSPTPVIVRSEQTPKADGLGLYKVDKDTYATTITPAETGFQEVLGTVFAVNAPLEYDLVGMSPDLAKVVQSTGGQIFEPDDVEGILQFAKTRARRTLVQRQPFRWPVIMVAIVLLLLEIFIRRWLRRE